MTTTTLSPLAAKFDDLDTQLSIEVLERPKEIHCALNALISRKHMFMVGPPGVAKSWLVRRLVDRIDFSTEENADEAYFQWLLTRYSTPEEIFGPPSLADLEQGHYRRNTKRKLPRATIAFLDETFKANSSILNALLTIMNERMFFNNGDDETVPLSSIFGASNELPSDDGLWALWDRLHFRFSVKPLSDSSNFVRMLQTRHEANPPKLLTWTEIQSAQAAAEEVVLPPDVFDALKMLRDNLRAEGVEPTERRFNESLDIIRAEAWMNGRDTAEIDDMRVLKHVLWSREEDQRIVERTVLELANPLDKEAHDLLERIEGLEAELDKAIREGDDQKQIAKRAVEIYAKLQKSKARKDELRVRAEESGRKAEKMEEVDAKFMKVAQRLMNEGFGLPGDVNA